MLPSEGYCELIDDNDEDSGGMGVAKLRQIRIDNGVLIYVSDEKTKTKTVASCSCLGSLQHVTGFYA